MKMKNSMHDGRDIWKHLMLVLTIGLTHGCWLAIFMMVFLLLETMCGGDFMSKNPEEALGFLSYVVEASKGWNGPNPREMERMKP